MKSKVTFDLKLFVKKIKKPFQPLKTERVWNYLEFGSYQILILSSGALYNLSPGLMSKAL